MEYLTESTSLITFSGEDWFDPLEDAIRFRVRAFIGALVEKEAQAALGGRKRYQLNGLPMGNVAEGFSAQQHGVRLFPFLEA